MLVDNVEQAQRSWHKLAACHQVLFIDHRQLTSSLQPTAIEPWGWNKALRAMLLRRGVSEIQMPTLLQLQTIRQLSHRRTAAQLLPRLRQKGTVGEAFECETTGQVEALLSRYGQIVMKAPWSSSGRGLRYLSVGRTPLSMQAGWLHNVVAMQESVIVEPYYNKVKDFGMEFHSDGHGHVNYLGLSLFSTANGAYTGNIIATENTKQKMIARYIPADLLNSTKEKICSELSYIYNGKYQGPLGVDMMVVGNGEDTFLLHPCVEINLRRTMGHVAISLSPDDDNDLQRVMRIEYSGNSYKLKIKRL